MQPLKAFRSKSNELFKFAKGVFSKKTLSNIVKELTSPDQSDGLKAFSAGFGVFIGIMPIWGLQTVAAICAALVFRLNKALVVVFSQVSFPPFIPLILYASYRIGRLWDSARALRPANENFAHYLYGSIALAFIAGLTAGITTYAALKAGKAVKQYHIFARLKKSFPTQ